MSAEGREVDCARCGTPMKYSALTSRWWHVDSGGEECPTPLQVDDVALAQRVERLVTQYGWRLVSNEVQRLAPMVPSMPARFGDPHTSVDAGRRKARRDVRRFSGDSLPGRLIAIFAGATGLTDQEATVKLFEGEGEIAPSRYDGARRRCSDLRRAGFLESAGGTRINVGSEDESQVWIVTPLGSNALANIVESGWSLGGPPGREPSDAECELLADEAEAGYDVEQLREVDDADDAEERLRQTEGLAWDELSG